MVDWPCCCTFIVWCGVLALLSMIGMTRARNLRQQASVDISDEKEMVPTEMAERDASRSPARGLLAAGSAGAPRLAGSAAQAGVLPPGGDGDILATLLSWWLLPTRAVRNREHLSPNLMSRPVAWMHSRVCCMIASRGSLQVLRKESCCVVAVCG